MIDRLTDTATALRDLMLTLLFMFSPAIASAVACAVLQ